MSQAKNGKNTDARLVTVYMRVNPETIEVNGQTGQIRYRKIGSKYRPCIPAKVPAEFAHWFMQQEWAEIKAEERSERCLVPDGRGGYIMCPERNKCISCDKIGHFDFDSNLPTSLDVLYEQSEREPMVVQFDPFDDTLEIMDQLVQWLAEIKPKYGLIFRERLNGNLRPLGIAKALGMGKSQVYDDVKRVRELAAELYRKMMDD